MSAPLTEGALVRLAARETTPADVKSQLFYPYYGGLTGTIAKIYADGTAAVTIDPQSLPEEIRTRHQKGTEGMRQKWLDGLSDEARNKLSAGEKKFALRYSLLVGIGDLAASDQPVTVITSTEAPTLQPAQSLQATLDIEDLPDPPRKSLAEIEAEEARHLAEVAQKRKG